MKPVLHALTAAVLMLAIPNSVQADDPSKVFEERLLPIFKSPNPSSCTKCHLAAVDLKDYLLPSARDTFLALREQGLIDLEKPEQSKILKLIERGKDDPKTPNQITGKMQKLEHDAFAAWIKACAADPAWRDAPKPEKQPSLKLRPIEVVRHARKERMLESFETNIWSMRFRCMNCHTEGTPQNDKLVKEHGDRVAWFKKSGSEATMEYLLASKLVDVENPEKSLLLTKPLGSVKHGGGIKFVVGDQGYSAVRPWLEDVACIKTGKYVKASDLPRGSDRKQFGTDIWLKIANTPDPWGDRLLQADVFAWDAATGTWEKDPIATTDRLVWGKGRQWQHNLTLLASPGSERGRAWAGQKPSLPPGKYLVKVYVDLAGKQTKDWKGKLGTEEYVGQVEVQSRWPEGYGAMTEVQGARVKK